MVKLVEMDQTVTIFNQLEQNMGPVVLINEFDVEPDEADQFIKAWAEHSAYFKKQPGFISTQLHRGIGGSSMFVNYAVWERSRVVGNGVWPTILQWHCLFINHYNLYFISR